MNFLYWYGVLTTAIWVYIAASFFIKFLEY